MKTLIALLFFCSVSEAQLALRNSLQVDLESRFQISGQYSLATDFLEQARPREYDHQFSLNGVYTITNVWQAGGLLDINYFTLNNEFVDTQKGYGKAQPSLNLFTSYRFHNPWLDSHNVGTSYYLPLDQYSRYEGYNGIWSLSTTMVKNLWTPRIRWIQAFRGSYQFNSFDKSAMGIPNRIYSTSATSMLSASITKDINVLLAFGFRWGHFADGNSDYSYNNSQMVSYSLKRMNLYVRHTNGGYTEDGRVYLWFIDKYRNYVDAGISYDF